MIQRGGCQQEKRTRIAFLSLQQRGAEIPFGAVGEDGGDIDRKTPASKATEARKSLDAAPIRELFETDASRVRSRGELGVLSSLNQRVWLQYKELDRFLSETGSGSRGARKPTEPEDSP
jgi:hypothetical protein